MSKYIKLKCLQCRKIFYIYPYQVGKTKYCSKTCRIKSGCGQFKKGNIPFNKDKKIYEFMNNDVNNLRKGKISKKMKGIKRSDNTRLKMSLRQRGEKCYLWKGGITSLYMQIRNSIYYKQWRNSIFTRDNWTCQKCSKNNCWIEAHHKKLFSSIIKENNIKNLEDAIKCKELWDLDNGVTLCEECHYNIKHRWKNKHG